MGKKRTITLVDSPTGEIEAEDLDFSVVKEDWNSYRLEDGTILKVKLSVAKISRGIDPKTKGAYILPSGEPLYNVRWNTNISAEVPEETFRKLRGH